MFKKIAEFFASFFASLFGNKKQEPAPPPKSQYDKLPGLIEDSSDVPQDTVKTIKVSEIDIIVNSPFADEDKDKAVDGPAKEDPTPSKPVPEPQTQPNTGGTTSPKPSTPKPIPDTQPEPAPAHKPRYLWCLDNGHGKLQPGKRSPVFDDGITQFLEYEFNRDVVERMIKALDEKGVKYFDVVPDFNDVGSFLEERVERANKKTSDLPKIYVSVHANAGPAAADKWVASSISGIETWFAEGSSKGKKIAAVFQKKLVDALGWKNRSLKSTSEKSLYVLTKTVMPAILTENGFYNNKEEVKELMKPEIRQKIADAHIAAIMEIEKNGI